MQLFWKMFLVIWLVGALGMSSVFLYLSSRVDSVHRLEVLEARARGQAQLMLERYEKMIRTGCAKGVTITVYDSGSIRRTVTGHWHNGGETRRPMPMYSA
jgi:hypothetical protein